MDCAEVREKHGGGEEMVEIAAPGDVDGVQLCVHRRRELQRGRDGRFRWLESDFAHRCEGGEAAPWEREVDEALPEAGFHAFLEAFGNGDFGGEAEDGDGGVARLGDVEEVVEQGLARVGGEEVEFGEGEDYGFGGHFRLRFGKV